jgi:hypothetical protein
MQAAAQENFTGVRIARISSVMTTYWLHYKNRVSDTPSRRDRTEGTLCEPKSASRRLTIPPCQNPQYMKQFHINEINLI